MTVVNKGSLTVGQCVPLALSAQVGMDSSINVVLPEVQAQVDGALDAQINLAANPPSLAGALEAALAVVAGLEAAIALGLPFVDMSVDANAALVLDLQARLGALNAQLSVAAGFGVTLGTPGVLFYTVSGFTGVVAGELATELAQIGGGVAECVGVVLLATSPAAQTALQATFGF